MKGQWMHVFVCVLASATLAIAQTAPVQGPQPSAGMQAPQPGAGMRYGRPQMRQPLPGAPSPGTLNYVEGGVSVNGKPLSAGTPGPIALHPGDAIGTGANGYAEVLLTPGAFLRLGNNSEVRMVSSGLVDTSFQVTRGEAMVEAVGLAKENHLTALVGGTSALIEKDGLYDFNAAQHSLAVLEGEMDVTGGAHNVKLKKNHELLLASRRPFKTRGLDENDAKNDPLYRWSKVRSSYEYQANMDRAQQLAAYGGWNGPGWYWDPWWNFYTFMPADGFLYDPFGYGFFGPGFGYGFGGFYGGYGGFGHHGPFHGVFHGGVHGNAMHAFGRGGFHGGGFHEGGGFHGGGGGFQGGGGFGGGHGGRG